MYLVPLQFIQALTKKSELFSNNDNDDESDQVSIAYLLFIFGLSIFAAVLSWRANTKENYPLSVKLVCAINAFNFGIFYIIWYLIFVYSDKSGSY